MVVPHHGQNTAELGRTVQIAVAHRIDGAVQSRPLAVPHGKDAVVGAFAEHGGLLCAQTGGGGQVLVDARDKMNGPLAQIPVGPPQLLVDIVHGRAAIAGNEAGGVQPRRLVAQILHHGNPHQGLAAGQIQPPLLTLIFVV